MSEAFRQELASRKLPQPDGVVEPCGRKERTAAKSHPIACDQRVKGAASFSEERSMCFQDCFEITERNRVGRALIMCLLAVNHFERGSRSSRKNEKFGKDSLLLERCQKDRSPRSVT